MRKITFFGVAIRLTVVLVVICTLGYRAVAQEVLSRTMTIKTNKADLVATGVLKSTDEPGKIFVGMDEAPAKGQDDTRVVEIPLEGHAKWNNRWENIYIKVIPRKGVHLKEMTWYEVKRPTIVYDLENNHYIVAKKLISDVVVTVTYGEGDEDTSTDDDDDDDAEYCEISYKVIAGQGDFEVVNADLEGGKYLVEKGDFTTIEVNPAGGYKIDYVMFDGRKVLGS